MQGTSLPPVLIIALPLQVGVGVTGLQLPFDIRFVWAGARLAFPFVRRGIAPEGKLRSICRTILGSC